MSLKVSGKRSFFFVIEFFWVFFEGSNYTFVFRYSCFYHTRGLTNINHTAWALYGIYDVFAGACKTVLNWDFKSFSGVIECISLDDCRTVTAIEARKGAIF